MEMKDKIKAIADHYGYDAQSRQCIEEMAELTQAINKLWRKSFLRQKIDVCDDDIAGEIADVQIMLWQLMYFLGCDIQSIIEKKLNRQLKRIKEECK